jgi:hypothetical protein
VERFKQLWKSWTLDKPAAFGDWLWEILVVQLAAAIERLTLRKIIALIPVVILILAYDHSIPLPPELMLVGDVLAYIDVFSVVLLLGVISRIAAFSPVVRRAAERVARLAGSALALRQRLDFRHRREAGAGNRKRLATHTGKDDGEYPLAAFA